MDKQAKKKTREAIKVIKNSFDQETFNRNPQKPLTEI